MQNVQTEGLELFKKKNADYGDSFANFGPVGVIVRMGDKINRLSSVTKNGVHLVDNESVRDTLIDLHNYAAMAIMLLDEKNKYVVASLKDNSIYFFDLINHNKIDNLERINIGERIRDMIKIENGLVLFLEDTASLAFVNLK